MARRLMNEYRVTHVDGTEQIAVRGNTVEAASDFELDDNPITQIQRTRTNLDVNIPHTRPPVHFKTKVIPPAAESALCLATPDAFTVPSGKRVVFQALPGAGFFFVGWFLDQPIFREDEETFDPEVPISEDLLATIQITAPAPGEERVIKAQFAPIP